MTNFIHAKVEVLPGLFLTVDGNSKITAGNGTYEEPTPNALSLPHIGTCPGSSAICRSTCYVRGLEKHAPEVFACYKDNERVIHSLLMNCHAREDSAVALGAWINENCRGGFRWHVSGDVMGQSHAQWIAQVCRRSPDVNHWIYTRTFGAVHNLVQAPNLVVNISADEENYVQARAVSLVYGFRLCYLSQGPIPSDLPEDSVVFPDYPQRGRDLKKPTTHQWWQELSQVQRKLVCPADFFGQSERFRCGPCSRCLVPLSFEPCPELKTSTLEDSLGTVDATTIACSRCKP